MKATDKVKELFRTAKKRVEELEPVVSKRAEIRQEKAKLQKLVEAHEMKDRLAGAHARYAEIRREVLALQMELDFLVRVDVIPSWNPINKLRQARWQAFVRLEELLCENQYVLGVSNAPRHRDPLNKSWWPSWMPSNSAPVRGSGYSNAVRVFNEKYQELKEAE